MEYQTHCVPRTIAHLSLEVECLRDLDQTIDDLFRELEKTGDTSLLESRCPYFGRIWPSALGLAERIAEIARQDATRFLGKRVLELGCGLAIPSMVATRLGASVVATDFHPDVPVFLKRNLKRNVIENFEYCELNWSNATESQLEALGSFDWVIGSDVLYERFHAGQLSRLVAHFVKPRAGRRGSAEALIADPARPYLQPFIDELRFASFRHNIDVKKVEDPGGPQEVFLIEVGGRPINRK